MDLSAQWENREPTTRNIGAIGLRAPEVILGANFDTKVDIWALGCMVSSCGAIVTRPSAA
jgi:serine/threonine protein kinase